MRAKTLRNLLCFLLFCSLMAVAQSAKPQPSTALYPQDTKTIESTLNALYAVISGPAGERDWARFRALFVPRAILIYNGRSRKGDPLRNQMTPEDYEYRSRDSFRKKAFYERAVANHIDRYGDIAQVFSTYESRVAPEGPPMERGINAIQMVWSGERWWVVSIAWEAESPELPIPPQYQP